MNSKINIEFSSEDLKVLKNLSYQIERLNETLSTPTKPLTSSFLDLTHYVKQIYIDGELIHPDTYSFTKSSLLKLSFFTYKQYPQTYISFMVIVEKNNIMHKYHFLGDLKKISENLYCVVSQEYTIES